MKIKKKITDLGEKKENNKFKPTISKTLARASKAMKFVPEKQRGENSEIDKIFY